MASLEDGVSFVVPVHNKARYLPRVLASIRAQRGEFPRDHVFVDDGSTDGSLDLLRSLTRDWPDTVIHVQENRGSANATNAGIARARRRFVKFVDADDQLAHDATALLLRALGDGPACLAYGQAVRHPEAEDVGPALARPLGDGAAHFMEAPLKAALTNSLFNPTQFLARTECLRQVGGCDERIVHSQEYSLTLRLARLWPFIRVEAPVAYLPAHVPSSLGTSKSRQLRRVTLACGYFLGDHPELPGSLVRFAQRRCAARAWKFARREAGAGVLSPAFWRHVSAMLGLPRDPARHIHACARAFGEG
jgi:hypothetical protein